MQQSLLKCSFTPIESGELTTHKCKYCGRVVKSNYADSNRIHASCKRNPGLGDRVQTTLAAFGITKARVNWVKRLFGFKKPCGCEKRQEQLNELGKQVGL